MEAGRGNRLPVLNQGSREQEEEEGGKGKKNEKKHGGGGRTGHETT